MSFILASTSHYIGIALDISLVVVLLTFACIGYYQGLFKSVLGLFSTAIVLILSFYFANHFAKLINTIFDFTGLIAKYLSPAIEKLNPVFAMVFPTGMSGTEFYNGYIASSNTNTLLKKFFQYILKGQKAESLQGLQVADVLAGGISSIIMTVIAGVLLFIIIKVVISLLSRFFDNITRLKVLGGLNKIIGFVFGALKGAVIILFFVIITIVVSFIPKVNKKLYPLINNDTKVVKVFYNATDTILEKYFIKTNTISKWIDNLWDSRDLEKSSSIADQAQVIDSKSFVKLTDNSYKLTLDNKTLDTNHAYFRINKLSALDSYSKVSISVTLEYESSETVNFQVYDINDLKTTLEKDGSSSSKLINYLNLNYNDYILNLNTTSGEIVANVSIVIIGVAE